VLKKARFDKDMLAPQGCRVRTRGAKMFADDAGVVTEYNGGFWYRF
jgi:hypothetical protein